MKVLISGGGTGGHIFPALSIANALRRRVPDVRILFVGAEGRMEMDRVPAAGYRIVGLPVSGFHRHHLWRNFRVLWRLWRSMRKAKRILREFRPDIAVGVGGYASGPMLKQAQRKGVPTLIQEQNSYPGVTNKLLAKKVDAICTAYPGMERFFPADKILLTGNPIRSDITKASEISKEDACRELGLPTDKPIVLIIGGSLGARTINDSAIESLPALRDAGAFVLWQTGKHYYGSCIEIALKYPDTVKAVEFVTRMDLAYRAADLVVSRAGAGTISELQVLGKATILIPSPNVSEDHQRKNAEALVANDAAKMILDIDARTELPGMLTSLLADKSTRDRLGENAAKMALRDADEKIVDRIMEIIKNK